MQITNSKLYRVASLCRGSGAAAFLLAIFANFQTVRAADGDLDPTFGFGGQVLTDLSHSTDWANAVAIQPDGKLVVVGTTYKQNDYSDEDFAVARYNTDGTLDSTFGRGGKVRTDFSGLAAVPSSVAIQPDGKIVVAGGAFPLFTFLGNFEIVRYNANGTLPQRLARSDFWCGRQSAHFLWRFKWRSERGWTSARWEDRGGRFPSDI